MSTPRWSVRLAVEAGDSGPISRALHRGLTSNVRRLSISEPAGAYDEGADVVTFELDAPDARNAPRSTRRTIQIEPNEDLLIAARHALDDPVAAEHLRRTGPRIERLLGLLAHRYRAMFTGRPSAAITSLAGGP